MPGETNISTFTSVWQRTNETEASIPVAAANITDGSLGISNSLTLINPISIFFSSLEDTNTGIMILLIVIIVTIAMITVGMSEDHGAIQTLFLTIALFTVIATAAIGIEMANDTGASVISGLMTNEYTMIIFTAVFVVFYIVILIIWNTFSRKKELSEEEEAYE